MARISDMNGNTGDNDGSYYQLFGDRKLAYLMSQIQAAIIRNGNELEKWVIRTIPKENKNGLANIFGGKIRNNRKEIVCKPKMPASGELKAIISDFAIFNHIERHFWIVELKAGYQFDTQKSDKAKENLQKITTFVSRKTYYMGDFAVCSFYTDSKDEIISGFKKRFSEKQIFTGPEFCHHLGIDYDQVLKYQRIDQIANREYLVKMVELIKAQVEERLYFESAIELRTGQLRLFEGIG